MPRPLIEFITPASTDELAATRQMFIEYAPQLGIDLGFQNFNAELADLPGEYSAPPRALMLALVDGEAQAVAARAPSNQSITLTSPR